MLGLGKHSARDAVHFVKKYHGYLMSFGTVLNFHYHPVVKILEYKKKVLEILFTR